MELTLTPNNTFFEGKICPIIVKIMCTVEDLPSLKWYFNEHEKASYVYSDLATFPQAIELLTPIPGMSIQIINATYGSTRDNMNAESLLTANISVQPLRQSIQCGSNTVISEAITFGAITTLGKSCAT